MALRPVYSTALFVSADAQINDQVGPVSGAVIVLRHIEVMSATGAANQWLFMSNTAGGMIFRWTTPLDERSTPYSWNGRLVLAPGHRMWFSGKVGTWAVNISGYELPNP